MEKHIKNLTKEDYRDLVDQASDMIQCVDYSGNFVYVNKSWKEKLGYRDEEIEKLSLWDIIHPKYLDHCKKFFEKVISGEKIDLIEAVFISKKGEFIHVEGNVSCRFNDSGKFISTLGIFRDVTERKEMKQSHQKQEKYLRTILETTQDGFWVIGEEGNIIDVNEAYCRMSGYTKEEILGMKIPDLEADETPHDTEKRIKRILKRGSELFETCHRRKDGSLFNVEVSVTCMSRKPVILVCFCRDITDRKRAEEELKKSLSRLKALLKNSPSPIIMFDETGYVEVSAAAAKIFGLPENEIRGKNFSQLLPPEVAEEFNHTITMLQKNHQPIKKNDVIEVNGSKRIFESRLFTIDTMNTNLDLFGSIANDITERKEMEQIIFNEKEKFRTTLLSVGDGVIATDNKGNIMVINEIAEKLTGWTQEESFGKPLEKVFKIINELTRKTCENPAKKVLQTGEIINLDNHTILVSKKGQETPIEDSAAPIKDNDGQTTGVVIVFRDFTEKKEKQKQIEYLSFHDHLTGLYNRRYIEDTIKRLDTERNLPFAIMVLDVNGLKLTNDAFGHEMGDQLLKKIAEIMKKVCRADDIIGRIGGDEFCILLPKTDDKQAEKIKERIIDLASKTKLDSVIVSAAVGYEVKTSSDEDIEEIQKNADKHMYKNKLEYGKTMRSQTIDTVVRSINDKYEQEQIHTERVSQYCEVIAREMNLSKKEIHDIKAVGILHDIGKIMVPAEILNKPGELTDEEFEIIKRHPETGYQILRSVDEYSALAKSVLYHHERWDGKGYPEGLKKKEIPLMSRILAVADAYEAMTAKRYYQKTKNKEEALMELKKCAGTQFDPDIVKIFAAKI